MVSDIVKVMMSFMITTFYLPVFTVVFPSRNPMIPSRSVLNTMGTVRKNANLVVMVCA